MKRLTLIVLMLANTATGGEWHKLKVRPSFMRTQWVYGDKDLSTGLISWVPDNQEAAWAAAGKKMPCWVMADDSGQCWESYDLVALTEHVHCANVRMAVIPQPRVVQRIVVAPPVYQPTPVISPMFTGPRFSGSIGFGSASMGCSGGACFR